MLPPFFALGIALVAEELGLGGWLLAKPSNAPALRRPKNRQLRLSASIVRVAQLSAGAGASSKVCRW